MIKGLIEKLLEQDFEDTFQPASEEELDARGFVPLKYKVKEVDFSTFRKAVNDKEGVVMLGAGGDPEQWINGVVEMWNEEGIYDGHANDAFEEVYKLTTSGGRTDLALVFNPAAKLNISKMAMWRLRFGDCSWISDYIVNYAGQH